MADLRKNVERSRFEVYVDGELAGYTEYEVGEPGQIVLPHTEVEKKFEGRGLAGEVVAYALDDIRSEGYLIRPECPYVKRFLRQHPEYSDMIAPEKQVDSDIEEDMEDVTGVSAGSDPRI